MKYSFLFIFLFLASLTHEQKKNYSVILPTGSESDIIYKAANIVPSPRQLRWQKLELTVKSSEGSTVGYKILSQFGPNTTDKVRLKIVSSRLNPTVAKIGLYLQPVLKKELLTTMNTLEPGPTKTVLKCVV